MDKLYSEEQVREWASKRADDAARLSRQLLDTMRENERLREGTIRNTAIPSINGGYNMIEWAAELVYPNKESGNDNI